MGSLEIRGAFLDLAREFGSSEWTIPIPSRLLFWEWLIGEIKKDFPDTLFLAEAFTRPKVMHRLAKLGFTQSYTYFAWRNTKGEITDYFTSSSPRPSSGSFSEPTSGRIRRTS